MRMKRLISLLFVILLVLSSFGCGIYQQIVEKEQRHQRQEAFQRNAEYLESALNRGDISRETFIDRYFDNLKTIASGPGELELVAFMKVQFLRAVRNEISKAELEYLVTAKENEINRRERIERNNAALRNALSGIAAGLNRPQASMGLNCTSTRVGFQTFTNCY